MDCEGFIDMYDSNRSFKERIIIFVDLFQGRQNENLESVDFVLLTKSLKDENCISEESFENLLAISESNASSEREKLCIFVKRVLGEVSIDRIYWTICKSGYSHLFSLFTFCEYKHRLSAPAKVLVPFSKYANERYRCIKMCVDNNCFSGDVKKHLNELEILVMKRLRDGRTQEDCQKYLEEKVAFDLHRIQLHGATDFERRISILKEMKETSTAGLDRTSLELTYHSKMAVTHAKKGNVAETKQEICETMVMCDRCVPCFATIMALNDVLYSYQELCFMNRTQEFLTMSLNHGQLFYHLLSCEDDTTKNQWKRITLLFMAMTLLNISHEFQAGDINAVTTDDIHKAKVLLDEVSKVSKDIEVRRKMVLNFCQGRYYEQSDRRVARVYVKKANGLSNAGCLRNTEKINIENYLSSLRG